MCRELLARCQAIFERVSLGRSLNSGIVVAEEALIGIVVGLDCLESVGTKHFKPWSSRS
jgi:hypothetical protein